MKRRRRKHESADMNPISPNLLIARGCLSLVLIAGAPAQDSAQAKFYPEHGKVIAAHLGIETVGSAGVVGSLKRWVYRVDGGNLYYDLQGNRKPSLTIGQDIDFRIEKENAYLKGARKKLGTGLSVWVSRIRSKFQIRTHYRPRRRRIYLGLRRPENAV